MDQQTKKVLASLVEILQDAEESAYQSYVTAMQTYTALVATVPDFADKFGEPTNLSYDELIRSHGETQQRLAGMLEELQRLPKK